MIKNGYTMLNVLLVMMIIATLTCITSINIEPINNDDKIFISNYLLSQVEAISKYKDTDVKLFPISFNENGGVNKAQTISINNRNFIIHLGTGYLSEKE